MALLAVLSLAFICSSPYLGLIDLASLSEQAQSICLNKLNFKNDWPSIYRALLCGKKLPNGTIKNLFVHGGLIHLMIVSGAHLAFLDRFWKRLNFPFFPQVISLILLTSYALVAGLQPPVVRALFVFMLFQISHSKKLFWSPNLITQLSALLCIVYSPSWLHSISLHLSLLASLAFNLSSSKLKSSFFVYACLFPILNRWQHLHPLTVLINWILAPFVGLFLLPLSMLTSLFHPLHHVTDACWHVILWFLHAMTGFLTQESSITWQLPEKWTGLYILILFGCNELYLLYKRSKRIYPK